jgi:hypothetical protein
MKDKYLIGVIFALITLLIIYLLNVNFRRESYSYSTIFYLIYDLFYIPIFLTCGYVIGEMDFSIKTRIVVFTFFVPIVVISFIFLR